MCLLQVFCKYIEFLALHPVRRLYPNRYQTQTPNFYEELLIIYELLALVWRRSCALTTLGELSNHQTKAIGSARLICNARQSFQPMSLLTIFPLYRNSFNILTPKSTKYFHFSQHPRVLALATTRGVRAKHSRMTLSRSSKAPSPNMMLNWIFPDRIKTHVLTFMASIIRWMGERLRNPKH